MTQRHLPGARLAARPLLAAAARAAAALAAMPARAAAQLAVDRVEIEMSPGGLQSRVGIVNVRNDDDRPVQAVVRLEDWDRDSIGQNRWFPYATTAGSCGDRLSVFPLAVSLDPGAAADLRVTLDADAPLPAECWAAVIVETAQEMGGGVRYMIRTAVKLYVMPDGLRREGEVVDVRPARTPEGAEGLEVVFANTGGRHVIAGGTLEFRRADNTVVATVPVPELYVLPGAGSRVTVALPELPAGDYAVLAILDYGGDDLAALQFDHHVPAR